MIRLTLLGILAITISCSESNIVQNEIPPIDDDQNQPDYQQFFDSLASYGAKYGFQTVVPPHHFDVVLSKPTYHSVTATVVCYSNGIGNLSCNGNNTPNLEFVAGEPRSIEITNLEADKNYTYQFHFKPSGGASNISSAIKEFSTTKTEGRPFSFVIIADSHLDQNSDTLTYKTTLNNISKEQNDFVVDMGDTFMTDKYGQQTYHNALGQYYAQRYYLSTICNQLPLFFVQGNHDGETGDKREAMTNWSKQTRERLFPSPSKNNYFAWEWGDALLIVLDPYTFTAQQGIQDAWQRSLGDHQYNWLEETLKSSTKKHKMVFIHNLVGGFDREGLGRGGAEAVPYFEWGGKSLNGSYDFAQYRVWAEPIHALLKRYGVKIVFHGHDHIYAKQEYDGLVYQCLQQPSLARYHNQSYGETYGYTSGVLMYNPGHLKVTVNSEEIHIDYWSHNNELVDSYTL